MRKTLQEQLAGTELDKLEDLFPEPKEMNELLTADEDHFLAALLRAVGPFLGVNTTEELRNLEYEPVGKVAQYYHGDLTLERVAAELGERDPVKLQNAIQFNPDLKTLLGPLLDKQVVKRTDWESRDENRRSTFQKAASEFNDRLVPVEFGQGRAN